MKIKLTNIQALSGLGKRENNEDSIYPTLSTTQLNNNLFLVCDGVGGMEKGEVASQVVCSSIPEYFEQNKGKSIDENYIFQAFLYAQNKIAEHIVENPDADGMGTTLTLLSLNDKGVSIAWAGDSRVYQIRNGEIIFKTADHSFVEELVRNGIISAEDALTHPKKNIITRAMQGDPKVKPDVFHQNDVQAGDKFFLCSDGVLESFDDAALCEVIAHNTPEQAVSIIEKTCAQHSKDNHSLYLIEIGSVEGAGVAIETVYSSKLLAAENKVEATIVEEKKEEIFEGSLLEDKPEDYPNKPKKRGKLYIQIVAGLIIIAGSAWAISHFYGGEKNNNLTENSDSSSVNSAALLDCDSLIKEASTKIENNTIDDDYLSAVIADMKAVKECENCEDLHKMADSLLQVAESLKEIKDFLIKTNEEYNKVSKISVNDSGLKIKRLNSIIDNIVDFLSKNELDKKDVKILEKIKSDCEKDINGLKTINDTGSGNTNKPANNTPEIEDDNNSDEGDNAEQENTIIPEEEEGE